MLDNWKNPTLLDWTAIANLNENSGKPAPIPAAKPDPTPAAKPDPTPKPVPENKKFRRMMALARRIRLAKLRASYKAGPK